MYTQPILIKLSIFLAWLATAAVAIKRRMVLQERMYLLHSGPVGTEEILDWE